MHDQNGRADIGNDIERWQQNLLDLTRRNRLLFFKSGKPVVRILETEPDPLIEKLSARRKGLSFPFAERRSRTDSLTIFEKEADTPDEESDVTVVPGDLTTDCAPLELQRRLRLLQQKDAEWDQEQGIKVLRLALGFLTWVDEDGYRGKAPILLLPTTLQRRSPKDPFFLHTDLEDPEISPTLLFRMSQLGIGLPELGDMSVSDYLGNVERAIGSREEWSVDRDIFLSTFAYNKLAIWQDLEHLREDGVSHPLILEMSTQVRQEHSDTGSDSGTPSAFPPADQLKGGKLDDLIGLRDQVTVINADFSQLEAIQSARRGQDLVIHGPPGTGKSQTITNIISALISDGKKVLFVSEKRSALDVVKRNLEQSDLGVFCLDLHSRYGRKSEVYRQLNESLNIDLRTRPMRSGRMEELKNYRTKLNQYVRALHKPREPMGRSMFYMAGIYASVQNLPAVNCESLSWISELDESRFADISQVADRIGGKNKEFNEHETSPWRPLRATTHYLGFGNEILRSLGNAKNELLRLSEASTSAARALGVAKPLATLESDNLRQLANHFVNAPGVLRSWLLPGQIGNSITEAKIARSQCRDLDEFERKTIETFGERHTWPGFKDFHSKLLEVDSSDILNTVAVFLGSNWKEEIPVDVGQKIRVVEDLHTLLSQLVDATNEAKSQSGEYPADSWENLGSLCRVGEEIVNLSPVPESWISEGHQIASEFERYRDLSTEIVNRKQKLGEVFSESFVGEVDQALLFRFRSNYQGIHKIFRPQYWRDRRFIRGHMRVPRKMSLGESLNWIAEALETNRLVALWNSQEESAKDLLGSRFSGIDTDWFNTEKAFQRTLDLVTNWPCELVALSSLLTNADRMHTLRLAIGRLVQIRDRIDDAWSSLNQDFPHNVLPLQMVESSATTVSVLKDVNSIVETILTLQKTETTKLDDLRVFVNQAIQFEQLEEEFEAKSTQLTDLYQQSFQGRETDWPLLESKLSWTNTVIDYIGGRDVPTGLMGECEKPKPAEYYVEIAESLNSDLTDLLSVHFDAAHSSWDSWDSAPFDDVIEWTDYLLQNPDEVADWIEYRTICRDIEEVFGKDIVSSIRAITDDSIVVPGILRRVLVEQWLNHVHESAPVLGEFSTSSHTAVWNKFRDLDRQLPGAIREEVRRRCFDRYPLSGQSNPSSGQIGILYRETNKKRRQLPVRQLLERVPTLVNTLKPCFLMSPLAVSQFLPLKSETFDVVIFDEASQVFPEDAIPSIVRSKQCIVVGDRKQLPPTSFFRRTTGESEDDEEHGEDEDFLAGMESVLDVMVGMVGRGRVAEQYLRVHYRSRHEHLIQFSNHWFYSERPLMVFPDPQVSSASKALAAIHVPDGVYVPTQRTNHVEAERIVDVVIGLMEKHGDAESIGVVALSRSQSDYINHRIDMRRMLVRHLDNCFNEELREPFFVKNLENVQGDERDHIVLGIGYGPLQEGGRTPNRFGALNLEGAGRRLNVAISRARKTMTVVHSVRDSDITSESEGARLLKSYLQYAANPNDFFAKETRSDTTGEPDSPFEESVIAALREKGYNVDSQIGVAGYRVDIGVLSDESDRYILGIECDGYTYHSSPTARDRDWLRQSILEGLGWKIHRVWSTSWIQNPAGALLSIEKAIQKARVASTSGFDGSRSQRTNPVKGDDSSIDEEIAHSDNELVENVSVASGNTNFESRYQIYKPVDLANFEINSYVDLAETDISILRPMILETVRVEMPIRVDYIVRRIRGRWNLRRAGNRIRDRVVEALSSTVRIGQLDWDPSTLTGPILQRFVVLPGSNVVPRKPGIGEPPRSIDEISKSEILEGILDVEKVLHGGSRADLISQTAKGFGYDQVGSKISKRISMVLKSLIRSGILRDENGVVLKNDRMG